MTGPTRYERLLADLDAAGAQYEVLRHEAEGQTERASALRGNLLRDAAKCLVLLVKVGKKQSRYVLAVVPGDARLDLAAIRELFGAGYVGFASPGKAEELAGSVPGTVLPFGDGQRLTLVADPHLLDSPKLYFNAGRLDRSLALATQDWVAAAEPLFAPIIIEPGPATGGD